ncbi:hypothetical protein H310_02700 [Aphanomyces invadans]|uniref:GST N-terminal domain-containing protein n=1 Tax=Aphanomyces invadans TaxID=157072 RepID=A0A024UJJ2_9STRA|nr:hypothetical protein H310_02700 [Aphanomyces invadans]ETW06444.1 hypothetical protein H310_02700 [Aphanomyces invadans]RHY33124.1 hypothetical protein DYB32_001966 [Aphanomyces invadans]|eukprot:XP_008864519.1 hypothetical protein H310_02700 [Aphanomyces invadans]
MATPVYPQLKLTYFEMPGRAHVSRLALVVAGIPFEDERISPEAWPALKPTLPYQQMPVLTVDGQVFAQAHAIERYVGSLSGLYPTSNRLHALVVDEIVDFLDDITKLLMPSFVEQDPDKKKALREELAATSLPRMFGLLEARLVGLPSKGPWVLGSISIADLAIHGLMLMMTSGFLDHIPQDLCDPYTRTMDVFRAVQTHPKVVEWFAKFD